MAQRYGNYLAYKNTNMPVDWIKEAQKVRDQMDLAFNMDIVTKAFTDWLSRRTTGLYDNFLLCLEKGPNEMKKEEFTLMDKMNVYNATAKLEACEKEFVKMRDIVSGDFKRDFLKEAKSWENWKWKEDTPDK